MTYVTRRQAAAGLLLLAISTATHAGQAARQHRPHHVQHPQHRTPPSPMPEKADRRTEMKKDRLLSQDRDRIRDQDIYGNQLMSAEERAQYRDRLQKAENDREWARIRAEHQQEIQARARAQGVDLEPPIHGQHMMTMEERSRFTSRMQQARGEAEREIIRNEHREFIRNRARELGMEEPPAAPRQ